jgi:hypothetical protein
MLLAMLGLIVIAVLLAAILVSMPGQFRAMRQRNRQMSVAFGRIYSEVADKADDPVAAYVKGEITRVFGEYPEFPTKEIE